MFEEGRAHFGKRKRRDGEGGFEVQVEPLVSVLDFDGRVHPHLAVLPNCPHCRRSAFQHLDAVLLTKNTAIDEVKPITGH